jgi:hypothetical protein
VSNDPVRGAGEGQLMAAESLPPAPSPSPNQEPISRSIRFPSLIS